MPLVQELIHKTELVSQSRWFKLTVALLAVLLLAVAYDLRDFRNMSTEEAMDAAQLGRNIAEGKGYTTLFLRPFSMHLVQKRSEAKLGVPAGTNLADYVEIRKPHPDISNPPVYPLVLAGLMKVLPFDYHVTKTKPFWSNDGHFWRYQPDFLIAVFNQILFLGVAALAFLWARRLFDSAVAWTSVALLLCTELLWRFSVSGLSTMLLILIAMCLVWCLTLMESEARESKWGRGGLLALSAAAGALVGVGALTRYAFLWLIIPVLIFLALFMGTRRASVCLIAFAAFAVVMAPWIVRNVNVSGTPFGTATYSAVEDTGLYPGDRLERSLHPEVRVVMWSVWMKLLTNGRTILEKDIFDMGGGWITALFLTGLLVGFRSPAIQRMRYFLLLCLGVLVVAQALGRTQLSEDSSEVNSENLLVVFIPVVLIFGVALFYTLLDQISLPAFELRYIVIGVFGVLVSLPLVFALLPPRTYPVAYPPYHPLLIQENAALLKQNELMMSDIPWAVAWYGNRECVWLTLNATPNPKDPDSQENFYSINDYLKPINALYLTPKTLDGRFLTDWVRAPDNSWGKFVLECIVTRKVPPNFPLRETPGTFWPEQLFLTDWKRW